MVKTNPWEKEFIEDRHKLFVEEFIVDMNATRAYKQIYWVSQKVAESSWSRLLSNDKVAKLVKDSLEKKFKKAEIEWQRVIERLIELVDRCMQRVPVLEYNKDTKELEPSWEWKFDSNGANKALDSLAKYYQLYVNKLEISWPNWWAIETVDISKLTPQEKKAYLTTLAK